MMDIFMPILPFLMLTVTFLFGWVLGYRAGKQSKPDADDERPRTESGYVVNNIIWDEEKQEFNVTQPAERK